MERSRSRLNIVQQLQVADRETEKTVAKLSQSDRSLFDWIPLTLLGAWIAFGGAEDTPSYWRDSAGIVRMRGLIKSGTIGTSFATMPLGFRPGGNRRFPVVSNNSFAVVSVLANGVATAETGSNVYVDLAAVSYRAEG